MAKPGKNGKKENEKEELKLDAPNKAGKKKIIIIIIAVLLLIGSAAGTYFMFFSSDKDTSNKKEAMNATPTLSVDYLPMSTPFVFNVKDGKHDRLVQITVQLVIFSQNNAQDDGSGSSKVNYELAKKHAPLLEGTLLRVFSDTSIDQLRSPKGREDLKIKALEEVNKEISKIENRSIVHSVLFTGFVIQ